MTLSTKANIRYRLQSVPLARAMADARNEAYVCVFPLQRAQSNEADYQWVSPIFIATSALFVAPDSDAQFLALSDAKKWVIGTLRGSGDAQYLKAFGFKVDEVSSREQNLEKLLRRRIDAWAIDVMSAQYFIQRAQSSERISKKALTFRRSLASLACNSKMPAADVAALQRVLDATVQNGSFQRITSEMGG